MTNKKTVFSLVALSIIMLVGCNAPPNGDIVLPPKYVNMTGVWEFTYRTQGKLVARMNLYQEGFKISGISNSKMGQFKITGNISGTKLNLQGMDYNKGRNFICVAKVTGENTFIGNYTIKGKKEEILGKRME